MGRPFHVRRLKFDEEKDEIFLQGKRIAYAAFEYYMLNKPAGVISATEDKKRLRWWILSERRSERICFL